MFLENAVVEQHQQPAIVEGADEPSEALFKRDYRGRNLVLEEGITAIGVDCFNPRGDHWIARHRERQAIDDDATELLPLYVNTLPEGRGRKRHRIRSEPKLLEQSALRRIALTKHGEFDLAEKSLIDVIHLRIAGEEHERPPSGDLEQLPNAVGGFDRELRSARIGQVGWNIEHRLALIIEV